MQRGLFKTKKGILIDADVNGGLNILRKVIGDGFIQNQKKYRLLGVSKTMVRL